KTSNDIYVVGSTNAGKSTLINKIITDYAIDKKGEITISPMPSTTLNEIRVSFNNFDLIDTPGLVENGNILNYVDLKSIKKISCKKEIKPRTYQIKKGQSLLIDGLVRIDYLEDTKNSFTFFISNDIDIVKKQTKNIAISNINNLDLKIRPHNDLVISGLGFIKIIDDCKIKIYINKKVEVFTRSSLI
ncbi:MAG: 50S ribosome-binding GTPase, partial [bacterium]|nr:50S ribosome-binding GTPase [bacterium]